MSLASRNQLDSELRTLDKKRGNELPQKREQATARKWHRKIRRTRREQNNRTVIINTKQNGVS
jgi:hypothetical protein